MKRCVMLLAIFCSVSNFLLSQNEVYFTELTKKPVATMQNGFIGFDSKVTTYYNTPCHLLKKTDPAYTTEFQETGGVLLARYKSSHNKDSLDVVFEMGASDDPNFRVYTKSKKQLLQVYCIDFYINALGLIYTAGHTNNMYNCKRKFQIQKDKITEVKQPFNYVGLKGVTKKAIVLYQDKIGNEAVATIPQNNEIEILLAPTVEDDKMDKLFLVKTKFGLVGWLRIADDEIFGAIIEQLFFAGD